MDRFAFAFYATQWRPDLYRPLHACLHSLDTRGGEAAAYPRYLVYAQEITPEIERFCAGRRLIPRHERRFTDRLSYPNKATMLRLPEHEVVCLTDLDIVFLADPTPMFEEAARTGKVYTRHDLIVPLWPWPRLPEMWGKRLRWSVAPEVWRRQYRRFARPGASPPAEMAWKECPSLPAYFNDGVAFVPGVHMRRLHDAWKHVALVWLRDVALRRPYTLLFTNHFTSQISYSIALYREQIPWGVLPSAYNFIPADIIPMEDRELLAGDGVVMAHLVSGVRHWLEPGAAMAASEEFRPLYERVQTVVRAVPLMDVPA